MVEQKHVESLESLVHHYKELKDLWRSQTYKLLDEVVELKQRIEELESKHDAGSQS
jgi:hypothetical protein